MTTWDDAKRLSNIESHKLDFAECDAIWDNFTITREDVRENYGERPQGTAHYFLTKSGET